jgi:hypothetical protein
VVVENQAPGTQNESALECILRTAFGVTSWGLGVVGGVGVNTLPYRLLQSVAVWE